MTDKKLSTKFTIQFNRDNLTHLQAVELLNRQNQRRKAQYIANAILHYESCPEAQVVNRPGQIDEKSIETIVNRILKDKGYSFSAKSTTSSCDIQAETPPQDVEVIDFDECVETFDEEGLQAIANTLEMFKRK